MKVKTKKAEKFGWDGVNGWSFDLDKIASFSYIEIAVDIPLRKNKTNNRVYMVIEGKLLFNVDGKKYVVTEKEAIYIPKNTEYSYKPSGKTKILEANVPPFDQEGEELISSK